jgi:hypothetical protein
MDNIIQSIFNHFPFSSWCNPKESGDSDKAKEQQQGGQSTTDGRPFCSDQLGLHRRRQEWIEGKNKEES